MLDKPSSATADGWDEWRDDNKTRFPIRFWLQETMVDAIQSTYRINISWPIRDWYWNLIHKYHPKHQYNSIKPRTLKPGYYDCDTRILHCVMEEVMDFFETGCNYPEWRESSDGHMHAYNELERVYRWWSDAWPDRETKSIWGETLPDYPTLPDEWGTMGPLKDKYRKTAQMVEWRRVSDIHRTNELCWSEQETEMLSRVIIIREYMWH